MEILIEFATHFVKDRQYDLAVKAYGEIYKQSEKRQTDEWTKIENLIAVPYAFCLLQIQALHPLNDKKVMYPILTDILHYPIVDHSKGWKIPQIDPTIKQDYVWYNACACVCFNLFLFKDCFGLFQKALMSAENEDEKFKVAINIAQCMQFLGSKKTPMTAFLLKIHGMKQVLGYKDLVETLLHLADNRVNKIGLDPESVIFM